MTFNFDNSLLSNFCRCEAAAIAEYFFGLRSKGAKVARDIGTAYHEALELHYSGQPKRVVVEKFEAEYNKVVPAGEQPEELRFERSNCIKIMERFCDVRPVEKAPFIPIEMEKIKGCAIDPDGEFVFWVKRDMLVKDKQSGLISPVDHKTTGNLTAWWARKFRLTSQMTGYCWMTGKEYNQIVADCYINGIEIKKLPDSMKRCPKHKVKYIECGIEHAKFELYQYNRTQEQLEKWKQDALVIARKAELLSRAFTSIDMLPYALRNGAFNEGCVFCDFKECCVAGFNPKIVESLCTVDLWEPWAKDEAERIDT